MPPDNLKATPCAMTPQSTARHQETVRNQMQTDPAGVAGIGIRTTG